MVRGLSRESVHKARAKVAHAKAQAFAKHDTTSIHDLEHTEQLRHMVLNLSRHGATRWQLITAWHGTAVKWAAGCYRLWLTFGVFVAVRSLIVVMMSRQNSVEEAQDWLSGSVPRKCNFAYCVLMTIAAASHLNASENTYALCHG